MEKCRAGIPVGVFSFSTPIEHYGNASCEAESEYNNGSYLENTTLQFTTTAEIQRKQALAFVVTDVHGQSYLIGCKEAPFPVVDITKKIEEDSNIYEVKVTFARQKSLIPCAQ